MSARSTYDAYNGAHCGKIGQFILDSRAEGRSVRWIQDHLQTEVSDALDAQDGAPQWG